jgi:hypothetical protein
MYIHSDDLGRRRILVRPNSTIMPSYYSRVRIVDYETCVDLFISQISSASSVIYNVKVLEKKKKKFEITSKNKTKSWTSERTVKHLFLFRSIN